MLRSFLSKSKAKYRQNYHKVVIFKKKLNILEHIEEEKQYDIKRNLKKIYVKQNNHGFFTKKAVS